MRLQARVARQARAAHECQGDRRRHHRDHRGFVDLAIVTHEHQDHVNGLTTRNFPSLAVGKVWFAWTESAKDDAANQLRKKFKDRLLGLIDTRAASATTMRLMGSPITLNSNWGRRLDFVRIPPEGNIELMSEKEVLDFKPPPWPKQVSDKRPEQPEDRKHRAG